MKKLSLLFFLLAIALFPQYVLCDLNTGLVAYYPFNGNAMDESGNNNNGVVNGAALTNDRFGSPNSAYNFNGESDYIEIADNETLKMSNYITLSGWFNMTDITPGYANIIINKDGLNSGTAYEVGVWGSISSLAYHLGPNTGLPWDLMDWTNTGYEVNDSVWIFFCITYDTQKSKVYINDSLIKEYNTDGLIGSVDGSLRIGGRKKRDGTLDAYDFFKGTIDEIRIYNRALSECEIIQLYNTPQQYCTTDLDNDGVPDIRDKCVNTPQGSWVNNNGCRGDVRYTEEDMVNMVNNLLQWDTNKDKHIGLIEVLQILRDTAGVIKSSQK
jgi:hypothetical protein